MARARRGLPKTSPLSIMAKLQFGNPSPAQRERMLTALEKDPRTKSWLTIVAVVDFGLPGDLGGALDDLGKINAARRGAKRRRKA